MVKESVQYRGLDSHAMLFPDIFFDFHNFKDKIENKKFKIMETDNKELKFQFQKTPEQQAVEEWANDWRFRLTPAASSKFLQEWKKTGKRPKPKSEQEQAQERIQAASTPNPTLEKVADALHKVGVGASVAGGLGALVAAPVSTAVGLAGSAVGKEVFDLGSKFVTGKSWADNVRERFGLRTNTLGEVLHPGMLVGGGMPFMTRGSRALLSAEDQAVKNTVKNAVVKSVAKSVEKYFPIIENQIFKLPYSLQEYAFPLRNSINYGIVYPRQNARISGALDKMRTDPALQGKETFFSDLSDVNDPFSRLFLVVENKDGGLRSLRAVINPGRSNPTTVKRKLFTEWARRKKDGDILTGDAMFRQDPINAINDLNLNTSEYGAPIGLSADSYKLLHDLGKKGTGMTIYSSTPTGEFNDLATTPTLYQLQQMYKSRQLSPTRYAIEAENYFRNHGTIIRQPYVTNNRVFFQHPSYVEGLNKYIEK